MKVYIVIVGCRGDEHIIVVYKTPELAKDRVNSENRKHNGSCACFEAWTVEDR